MNDDISGVTYIHINEQKCGIYQCLIAHFILSSGPWRQPHWGVQLHADLGDYIILHASMGSGTKSSYRDSNIFVGTNTLNTLLL